VTNIKLSLACLLTYFSSPAKILTQRQVQYDANYCSVRNEIFTWIKYCQNVADTHTDI